MQQHFQISRSGIISCSELSSVGTGVKPENTLHRIYPVKTNKVNFHLISLGSDIKVGSRVRSMCYCTAISIPLIVFCLTERTLMFSVDVTIIQNRCINWKMLECGYVFAIFLAQCDRRKHCKWQQFFSQGKIFNFKHRFTKWMIMRLRKRCFSTLSVAMNAEVQLTEREMLTNK